MSYYELYADFFSRFLTGVTPTIYIVHPNGKTRVSCNFLPRSATNDGLLGLYGAGGHAQNLEMGIEDVASDLHHTLSPPPVFGCVERNIIVEHIYMCN